MEASFVQTIAEIAFYLVILISSLYTLVFSYHWYSYGSSSKANAVATGAFLFGVGTILFTMWLSIQSF